MCRVIRYAIRTHPQTVNGLLLTMYANGCAMLCITVQTAYHAPPLKQDIIPPMVKTHKRRAPISRQTAIILVQRLPIIAHGNVIRDMAVIMDNVVHALEMNFLPTVFAKPQNFLSQPQTTQVNLSSSCGNQLERSMLIGAMALLIQLHAPVPLETHIPIHTQRPIHIQLDLVVVPQGMMETGHILH